jgi:hypothetical protein
LDVGKRIECPSLEVNATARGRRFSDVAGTAGRRPSAAHMKAPTGDVDVAPFEGAPLLRAQSGRRGEYDQGTVRRADRVGGCFYLAPIVEGLDIASGALWDADTVRIGRVRAQITPGDTLAEYLAQRPDRL